MTRNTLWFDLSDFYLRLTIFYSSSESHAQIQCACGQLIKEDFSEITEDFEIAEYMNNYFSSTFTDEKFENFPTFNKMTI